MMREGGEDPEGSDVDEDDGCSLAGRYSLPTSPEKTRTENASVTDKLISQKGIENRFENSRL